MVDAIESTVAAAGVEARVVADEYHPSGDGHGVWAEAVLASLGS